MCAVHGGRAPQVKRAAAHRLQVEAETARATRYLERRLGGSLPTDPAEALEGLLALDAADVAALRELVAELPGIPDPRARAEYHAALAEWLENDREGNPPDYPRAIYGPNHLGDLVPHVLVAMYRAAKVDLRDTAKAAGALGLAERRQTLQEAEGAMIAAMLDALFRDPRLQLSGPQRDVARLVAGEHLERLEAEVVGEAA